MLQQLAKEKTQSALEVPLAKEPLPVYIPGYMVAVKTTK